MMFSIKNYFNQRFVSVNKKHNYHKCVITHFHGAGHVEWMELYSSSNSASTIE